MRVHALALLALAARAEAAADPARYIKADLVSETTSPKPGSTILIGILMTPKPGWHGYWSNPGDSGIAPSGSWSAPAGVKIGPLLHPAPTLMVSDGIASFIHSGRHMLLAKMRVPSKIRRGTRIPIIADLRWAACTPTQCVPLKARLTLNLTVGNGAAGIEARLVRAAAAKIPRLASDGTYARNGKSVRLTLPAALKLNTRKAVFFPNDSAPFDVARSRAAIRHGRIAIDVPTRSSPPPTFGGVVSDGTRAYRIAFRRARH